jgi:hypothetical protein
MAAPKKKRYCGPRLTYARATLAHLRLLGHRSLQLCKSALRVPVEIQAPALRWMFQAYNRPALQSPLRVGPRAPLMPWVVEARLGVVGPQLWVCRAAPLSQAAASSVGPAPIVGSPWRGLLSPQALVTYYAQAWERWGQPNG